MGSERERIGELSLLAALGTLPDPRGGHGRRHPPGAIPGLARLRHAAPRRQPVRHQPAGRDQGQDVSVAWGFTGERTPRVSTLRRVFSRLDREVFEQLPGQWLQERVLEAGESLAIDGKWLSKAVYHWSKSADSTTPCLLWTQS